MLNNITFQINITPYDYKALKYILPHQLGVFSNQCDEILLTVDLDRYNSKDNDKEIFFEFLNSIKNSHPQSIIDIVDYSNTKMKEISDFFFIDTLIPKHDSRGGAYYSYFYGIYKTKNDYVFHVDSDMMFGGLSENWLNEALVLLDNDHSILCCNPLAGFPKNQGREIIQKNLGIYKNDKTGFLFDHFTTRVFLINKNSLRKKLKLEKSKSLKELVRSIRYSTSPIELVEDLITKYMRKNDLLRLDFLGSVPGLWSVHPIVKNNSYYSNLEKLINKIESNDIPTKFSGHFNLFDITELI